MNWPLVSLSSLVEIKGGGTPSKVELTYWNGDIPWASVKDFKSSTLSGASDYITQAGIDNSATSLIEKGNIIIPTRMALGKIAINTVDLAINQDLKALIIRDHKKVDLEYLFRCIQSKSDEIIKQGKGATVKGITLDVLNNLKIPLPPLETQKKIATVLEKADQLRKDCQLLEQELNSLAQSVFIDIFGDPVTNSKGWILKTIGDVATKVTDGEHQTPQRTDSGYKLLSARNVQHGFLDVINEKVDYIGEEEFLRISKRLTLEKSDVLLSCSGTIGRAALNTLDEPFCLVRSAAVIRLDHKVIIPEFIVGYLNSKYMQSVMHHEANSSGQPNLFQNQIRKLPLYIPPLQKQNNYRDFLAKNNEGLADLKNLKTNLDELFSSLMQKAFNGDLNLVNAKTNKM